MTQKLLRKPEHKLAQETETRWNSTYHMLMRLQEQKECVVACLTALGPGIEPLTQEEWKVLDETLKLLQPLRQRNAQQSQRRYQ
jgi:hypothetical protein